MFTARISRALMNFFSLLAFADDTPSSVYVVRFRVTRV